MFDEHFNCSKCIFIKSDEEGYEWCDEKEGLISDPYGFKCNYTPCLKFRSRKDKDNRIADLIKRLNEILKEEHVESEESDGHEHW